MYIDLAVAKCEKYASRESGDTVELVERPAGGFSVVMIDGQGSGKAAKTLSLLLSSKAVALLKEGVRDGVVARATHDYLFAFRHGQVSATLDLLSVDLKSKSIVVTRNAHAPMLLFNEDSWHVLESSASPIGLYRGTRPLVQELPLQPGVRVVICSDGIPHSGIRLGKPAIDFAELANELLSDATTAQIAADRVLSHALERDKAKANDDMAVVVLQILDEEPRDAVRRLQAQIPLG